MRNLTNKHRLLLLILSALVNLPGLVQAAGSLLPVVPEAQDRFSETQGCVEPTDDMRRNHMNYILHQRDETVHQGIRTKKHSLNECINCHVSGAPDAPRYTSEEHFCNSCHTFAAVHIDCFQCHADRPVNNSRRATLPHHVKTTTAPIAPSSGPLEVSATEGITHD